MINRRTVSYFNHISDPTADMNPDMFCDLEGEDDMRKIKAAGYEEAVLCVTEEYRKNKALQRLLGRLTTTADEEGLLVTADLWRVGGIFGGEGKSKYEQNGGMPCICSKKLKKILYRSIDTVAEAGITRLFLDEPEIRCPIDDPKHTSLGLIELMSERAKVSGITWVSSCIRSRESSTDMSDMVASLDCIDEVAVAPYPFHPQNLTPKPELEIVSNLEMWFNRIKTSADRHGKSSQAWIQGFNVSQANLYMLEIYLNQIKKSGIGNVAVWGYNGCERIRILNPKGALPGKQVYEEVTRLLMAA